MKRILLKNLLLVSLSLIAVWVYSYTLTSGEKNEIDVVLDTVEGKIVDYSIEEKTFYIENILGKLDILINKTIDKLNISYNKKIFYKAVLGYIQDYFIDMQMELDLEKVEDNKYKIGLNFIKFFYEKSKRDTEVAENALPENIFADFQDLSVKIFRQYPKADWFWNVVEPTNNNRNWDNADVVINEKWYIKVLTLFSLQYASTNSPWLGESDTWKLGLSLDAKDYLDKIIERYGDEIKYWEIWNEMDHWRFYDEWEDRNKGSKYTGPMPPVEWFTPQQQWVFLKLVSNYIRSKDSDAIIVLPGMSNINKGYMLSTWFPGVIEGAWWTDFFDIINYHYYDPWYKFAMKRKGLKIFMKDNGMEDKKVWLTETGVSSDSSLDIRTDYPNSEEEQAKDVFRRIILSYAHGDSLVLWHTHTSSPSDINNDWRGYGILTREGDKKKAYYSYKLIVWLVSEIDNIEIISEWWRRWVNTYKLTMKDWGVSYVIFGQGDWVLPSDKTSYIVTNIVSDSDGNMRNSKYLWGDILSLENNVYLVH